VFGKLIPMRHQNIRKVFILTAPRKIVFDNLHNTLYAFRRIKAFVFMLAGRMAFPERQKAVFYLFVICFHIVVLLV
jgi:hypothetical protein